MAVGLCRTCLEESVAVDGWAVAVVAVDIWPRMALRIGVDVDADVDLIALPPCEIALAAAAS